MKEHDKEIIPQHIFDLYFSKYELYPSIMKTKNITHDGLTKLISNNKMEWLDSEYDGKKQKYNQGVISYGNNQIFIFFDKLEHENIYILKILYSLKDNESVNFLLVGLNKYFTID